MPIYIYECLEEKCLNTFEVNHLINDIVKECSKCGCSNLKKVINNVNIQKSQQDITKKDSYKEAVEEAKNNIESEKNALKNRKWK